MSAFAVCWRRDGALLPPELLPRLLAPLRQYGPDGQDRLSLGAFALGHQHFWTTPEERNERQPLVLAEAGLYLVWDGRIDNRQELYSALPRPLPPLAQLSDAALFLHAYRHWREGCFPRLLGPFATAIHDATNRELVLARDPLGQRGLSFHLSPRWLVAATEDSAVLAHPEVPKRLNEKRLALYFTQTELIDGSTFFEGSEDLLPGHYLRIDAGRAERRRYWTPDPGARLDYKRDEDYAEQFHALLNESVKCRLRAPGTPAVLMSGGLDSAPLAALAAQHQRSRARQQRVQAVSWVFDEFPECDERSYMEAMYAAFPLHPLQVRCDDAWPLGEFGSWPVHPTTPEQNPYRRFHERAYAVAHESGARVVLSGMSGDTLYLGAERWLGDLVRAGRIGQAFQEIVWRLHSDGWSRTGKNLLVHNIIPPNLYRRLRPSRPPAWLTERARRLLPGATPWPLESVAARRPHQYLRNLELMNAHGFAIEAHYAARHAIELRYPFRDRRLIEFMLQIPTEQLQKRGVTRPILRRALRQLLPAPIRERPDKTSFEPLFRLGVYEKESSHVQALLTSPSSLWSNYVQAQWLTETPRNAEHLLVTWLCISCELWRQSQGFG